VNVHNMAEEIYNELNMSITSNDERLQVLKLVVYMEGS